MSTRKSAVKRKTVIYPLTTYETVRVSPEARRELSRHDIKAAVCKNAACDWGNVTADEWSRNDKAHKTGGTTIARYISAKGKVFLVIVESGNAAPRVLIPAALRREKEVLAC